MRGWVFLTILVLGACSEEPGSQQGEAVEPTRNFGGEVAAEVYGQPIAEDLLISYLQVRGLTNPTAEQRQQALDSLVDLFLLEHEARQSGMLQHRAFKARMEVQRLSWIASDILTEFASNNPITDAEVQQAYELEISNRSSLEYRLRHILLPDEQDSIKIIARLQGGESFLSVEAEMAAQVGSSNAGALGWVNLAQVPAGFATVLPTMQAGRFSTMPIATEYGFHVLYLEEVRSFAAPDIESLKAGIQQTLGRRRLEEHMSELRAAAGLGQINQGN
jgi:peptidyl-prolyl cis-trans isomerase C